MRGRAAIFFETPSSSNRHLINGVLIVAKRAMLIVAKNAVKPAIRWPPAGPSCLAFLTGILRGSYATVTLTIFFRRVNWHHVSRSFQICSESK
jgi:hypothetical protein